jgi:hypothetical protein
LKRPKPNPITNTRSDPLSSSQRRLDGHLKTLDLAKEQNKRGQTIARHLDAMKAAQAKGAAHKKASLSLTILLSPTYDRWLHFKVKGRTGWREAKRETADVLWRTFLRLATLLAYLIWIPVLLYLASLLLR